MKKMTPAKRRQKLARVLSSGTYTQGRGRLKEPKGGYCCLGVAAVLEDPEGKNWGPHESSLSGRLGKKYGFSETHMDCLICLNDSCKASFAEIAAIIGTPKYFKQLKSTGIYTQTKTNMMELLKQVRNGV